MSDTQTCSGRDMSRFPTIFCVHGTDGGSLLSHDMNEAVASAEGGSPEYPVQFVPPHMHGPEFVPVQILNLFLSLCGAFPALFRQRSASPGGGLGIFSNSFCNTSVCLSRAIRKSDRLTSCHFFALSDCGARVFVCLSWNFFSAMFIMMSKIVAFTLSSLQRLLQTGVLLLQQQQFLAKLHYFLLFSFSAFPFLFMFSPVKCTIFFQPTLHWSPWNPYFLLPHRPMLCGLYFPHHWQFERHAVIFLRPFLILFFSFFSFCYFFFVTYFRTGQIGNKRKINKAGWIPLGLAMIEKKSSKTKKILHKKGM